LERLKWDWIWLKGLAVQIVPVWFTNLSDHRRVHQPMILLKVHIDEVEVHTALDTLIEPDLVRLGINRLNELLNLRWNPVAQ
jgi:hypothetical protein